MIKPFHFLVVVLFLLSCQQKKSDNVSQSVVPNDSTAVYSKNGGMQFFSVPFNRKTQDQHSLSFGWEPSFGTAFVLNLYNTGTEVQGVAYEVRPEDRGSIFGFNSRVQKVLPFEGYSFTIDLNRWNALVEKVENVLSRSSSSTDKSNRCFDGTYYYIEYGDKQVAGHNCEEDTIAALSKYIEQEILTPVHELRKAEK
ncbi:hypothetical protein [Chitinophaga filiformis]|uniref:Uncharacterized protein n=1 Tax=Chitinophaga filiformis TaxID=104663 RepID=A0A1G8AFN8_CHIFI|nr:hypothetical protein [Chitinophaga filiformis]SDH19711.1 hypothetical protein SAMN04488121_109235 [Chitinophaga filiformis]